MNATDFADAQQRTNVVAFRLSDHELHRLDDLAASHGVSRSSAVRLVLGGLIPLPATPTEAAPHR